MRAADLDLSHAAVCLVFYLLATAESSLKIQFPARGNSCLSWSDNYQPDAFVRRLSITTLSFMYPESMEVKDKSTDVGGGSFPNMDNQYSHYPRPLNVVLI